MRPVISGNHNGETFAALPFAYLTGSFRNCVFGDLGGSGPPGVDAINCDFTGAKFQGSVKDIQSRGSTFTNARLPENIPHYCHDMMRELFRQMGAKLSAADRTASATIVSSFNLSGYAKSYQTTVADWPSKALLKKWFTALLALTPPQPGLAAHIKSMWLAWKGEQWLD